jgi:phosphoadenosine phosphosulfate reductase
MTPEELIEWSFKPNYPTIITTSFGEYSAVLLHMIYKRFPNVPVVWIDTQFNTQETLQFKDKICRLLNVNLLSYKGNQWNGTIPNYPSNEYDEFVEQVKLKPFKQSIQELNPTFWITGIRREETTFRKQHKQIHTSNGIIKVAPLFYWTSKNMEEYLEINNLPNEANYFDPTKPDIHSECGMHTKEIR